MTPEEYIIGAKDNVSVCEWGFWPKTGSEIIIAGQPCFANMSFHNYKDNPIQVLGFPFRQHLYSSPYRGPTSDAKNDAVIDLILHPYESPVRSILSRLSYKVIKDNSGYLGIVIENPDIDSASVMTVLFALRHSWERTAEWQKSFNTIRKTNSGASAFFLSHCYVVGHLYNSSWHGGLLKQTETSLKSFKNSEFESNTRSFSTYPGHTEVSGLWSKREENQVSTFFTFDKETSSKYNSKVFKLWSSIEAFYEQIPNAVRNYYSQFKEGCDEKV